MPNVTEVISLPLFNMRFGVTIGKGSAFWRENYLKWKNDFLRLFTSLTIEKFSAVLELKHKHFSKELNRYRSVLEFRNILEKRLLLMDKNRSLTEPGD